MKSSHSNPPRDGYTVFIRITALDAYWIFGTWEWALIRGWVLFKFSPFSASEVCLFCNKTITANNKTRGCNKARFLWRKLRPRGSLLLEFIIKLKWVGWQWALIWVWLGGGGGGRLFEAGRLLTFSAFRTGAYSRWTLIRGWALIRINTVSR